MQDAAERVLLLLDSRKACGVQRYANHASLKIGSKRIFAIHSGPGYKKGNDHENEDPEMPENVERALKPFQNERFGYFKICPLEPEVAGNMQAVCIESAKNIVADP